jgi:hypothetical protein
VKGLVVAVLPRRVFHEEGGGGDQNAAFAPDERQLATADGIDDHPGGFGGILHGETYLQVHWYVSEYLAFHANKANFVVFLPGDIIAGADMDILIGQALRSNRLDGLGFRLFLGQKPPAIEHIEKICMASRINLIRADQLAPRFLNKSTRVRWTRVAPSWDLMSSPMRGRFFSAKRPAHSGSLAMKTGMLLMKATDASRAHSA